MERDQYVKLVERVKNLEDRTPTVETYDTGWINTNDWTSRELGSTATPKNTDSNIAHNLNANLSELIVKLFVSTDGTDNNSFEVQVVDLRYSSTGSLIYGYSIFQVDSNNLLLHTGSSGIRYVEDTGGTGILDTDDYYYKVKVWKIAP